MQVLELLNRGGQCTAVYACGVHRIENSAICVVVHSNRYWDGLRNPNPGLMLYWWVWKDVDLQYVVP